MERPCGVYAETRLPIETKTKLVGLASTTFEKAHLESISGANATNITIYAVCTICPFAEPFSNVAKDADSYWEALSRAIEDAKHRVEEVKRLDCNQKV